MVSEGEDQTRIVSLEMDEDSFVRLKTLIKAAGYKADTEFFTDAVEVFGILLEERARGKNVGFVDKLGEVTAILDLPDHRSRGFCR